jgi:hypothetical protein
VWWKHYFKDHLKKGYDKIKKKLVQQIPLSKKTIEAIVESEEPEDSVG